MKQWSKDELKLLKELYQRKKRRELAEIFGCSIGAVAHKAACLGLRKIYLWSAAENKLTHLFLLFLYVILHVSPGALFLCRSYILYHFVIFLLRNLNG